nr:discoidin domain-containing protein [Siphonobacter sp. BAB-5405]
MDGWDAPWSRISYDEIPFEEIYYHIKSIQPNCLVMDLNAAKYPAEALYYTDIKSYEQGAGQHISKETNRLPALSCLPINGAWFWKTKFPNEPVKDPAVLVKDNLVPFNKAYCNFILNVAPNREGLIDPNALAALQRMGELWTEKATPSSLPTYDAPVISSNLAKKRPANGSWSNDMDIFDFGNDDSFRTSWRSNPTVKNPWYEVTLDNVQPFNLISIYVTQDEITAYQLEYLNNGKWHPLTVKNRTGKAKIHRFPTVYGEKVRMRIDGYNNPPSIAEFGVYNERN